MDRTEEDKLVQSPIVVILGGKEFSIRPLVIRESREWRKQLVELVSELPRYAKVTTDTPDAFEEALNAVLVALPDKVTDLFFNYAKDLNRGEIEAVATDTELAIAFEQVVDIAFPLAKSMTKTMAKLAQ